MSKPGIIIIGAGPAGAITSLFLSKYRIPHTIIDKDSFPREKVCGDAATLELTHTLSLVNNRMVEEIISSPGVFLPSWGFDIWNDRKRLVRFSFRKDFLPYAPTHLVTRYHLDAFLHKYLPSDYCCILDNHELTDAIRYRDRIELLVKHKDKGLTIPAGLVVGADGAHSLVKRKLGGQNVPEHHYYLTSRAYFEGVSGTDLINPLEFYFLHPLQPGYFWIFPLPDGKANVGIGATTRDIKRKKINLEKHFWRIINEHPIIKQRFSEAKITGKLKGGKLPIYTNRPGLSGDRYMLLGDAGSLIEPFLGKGMGMAVLSGKLAALTIKEIYQNGDYTKRELYGYDEILKKRYHKGLVMSEQLMKLAARPFVFGMTGTILSWSLVHGYFEKELNKWLGRWM